MQTNIFKQNKELNVLEFQLYFKDINIIDDKLPEDIGTIAYDEVKSNTIESMNDDIWKLSIYLSSDFQPAFAKKLLTDILTKNNIELLSDIMINKLENKDWASEYYKNFKPIILNDFIILNDQYDIEKSDIKNNDLEKIYINTSRAFGMGEHETTSGCIKMLSALKDKEVNNILDLGTGSGILAIIAKKLFGSANVIACDIDAVAVESAKSNAKYNNVDIDIFQNDYDIRENIARHHDHNQDHSEVKFDIILCNILSGPLLDYAHILADFSTNGSYLILAGFLAQQEQDIIQKYEQYGFKIHDKLHDKQWSILTLTK